MKHLQCLKLMSVEDGHIGAILDKQRCSFFKIVAIEI